MNEKITINEGTMKDDKDHQSISSFKERRSSQRISSRLRSATERQDSLEKIKVFPKGNKKFNKEISTQAKYIKENNPEEEILSISQTFINILSNQNKAKDIKPLKLAKEHVKEEEDNKSESTHSFIDHDLEQKTTNDEFIKNKEISTQVKYIKENTPEEILSTSQTSINILSNQNKAKDIKPLKLAKEHKQEEEEKNKSESTHSFIDHDLEQKTTNNDDQPKININSNSDGTICTDNPSNDNSTIEVSEIKPPHTFNTPPDDLWKNADTLSEHSISTLSSLVASIQSIFTDPTVTSTHTLTATSELDLSYTESPTEEVKKKNCRCWSIISAIGGLMLLITVYYNYFGTSMSEKVPKISEEEVKKIAKEKCENTIGIYMNDFPIENNYVSVEKYFDAFKHKNTDTECTSAIFETEINKTLRKNIDVFFKKYAQQMVPNFKERTRYDFYHLKEQFEKYQKFYQKYEPLQEYFEENKSKLEKNKELIPAYMIVSDFDQCFQKVFKGLFVLSHFEEIPGVGYRPEYKFKRHPYTIKLQFCNYEKNWMITYDDKSKLIWKNSTLVSHPGKLDISNFVNGHGNPIPEKCKGTITTKIIPEEPKDMQE